MGDDFSSIPLLPLRVGDSNQYVSGVIGLSPSILIEITVKDVLSGETWTSGRVIAPSPLDAFGKALNSWRASITYPADPEPPSNTLDSQALRPYCWRYRYAYEYIQLDEATLKSFRLQLYQEWKAAKEQQGVFPFGPNDHGPDVRHARKAERRNFNDALDAYLERWIQNRNADPYKK